jgi:thiamine-monophosphate kinase
MSAADVGYRALACNLSDIAAKGARPVLITIAFGVSPTTDERWVREFYAGLARLAAATKTAIAGGDIMRAPVITISITIIGEVRASNTKLRSGARVGDAIAVTGPLGASRAGLTLAIEHPDLCNLTLAGRALAAYRTPVPRLEEGRWLAASRNVHAMMDLSDGLSTDLPRMCKLSGCGAVVEDVPVDASAAEVAAAAGADPLAYAVDGGEDFELLVAIDRRAFSHLARRFEQRFGKPLFRVGTFVRESGVSIRRADELVALASRGWDHLRA